MQNIRYYRYKHIVETGGPKHIVLSGHIFLLLTALVFFFSFHQPSCSQSHCPKLTDGISLVISESAAKQPAQHSSLVFHIRSIPAESLIDTDEEEKRLIRKLSAATDIKHAFDAIASNCAVYIIQSMSIIGVLEKSEINPDHDNPVNIILHKHKTPALNQPRLLSVVSRS